MSEDKQPEEVTKKDDGFISLTSTTSAAATFPSMPIPAVFLGRTIIYMTIKIWEDLGSPEYVGVLAEPKKKLLRFDPYKGEVPLNNSGKIPGYRKIGDQEYRSGENQKRITLTKSVGKKSVLNMLARGYYLPVGGGVYKYHGPNMPQR